MHKLTYNGLLKHSQPKRIISSHKTDMVIHTVCIFSSFFNTFQEYSAVWSLKYCSVLLITFEGFKNFLPSKLLLWFANRN